MTGPIAIAGAGIGGLTAALALAQRGITVLVGERAAQLEEAGAGIQLTPNALNVLFALGLGPALERAMVRIEAVLVRQGTTGRLIQRLPLDQCEARWGAPYAVIHRADLQAILVEAVQSRQISLALNHGVSAVTQNELGVQLQFDRGDQQIPVAALIGADGLWSTVRSSLGLKTAPRFAGRRAWRTLVPMSEVPELFRGNATGLWLGARAHLVHYPVRGGELLNLVAVTQDGDPGPGWSTPQPVKSLLPHFAGWDPRARAMLGIAPEWRTWPLFDRSPEATMAHGRIALLGDAAHPMLPFVAQGGAAAIEDAAELAVQLAQPGNEDIAARLRAWSALRLPRVSRLQAEARSNGERYHWRWPASTARDLGLAAIGGKRMLERYDWIYGWKPTATYVVAPQMA